MENNIGILKMDKQKIAKWVEEKLQTDEYEKKLLIDEIDGFALMNLSSTDMKELFNKIGHRLRIEKEIQLLNISKELIHSNYTSLNDSKINVFSLNEEDFECPVCFKIFFQPITLSCITFH
jgi:hypothetical protein